MKVEQNSTTQLEQLLDKATTLFNGERNANVIAVSATLIELASTNDHRTVKGTLRILLTLMKSISTLTESEENCSTCEEKNTCTGDYTEH